MTDGAYAGIFIGLKMKYERCPPSSPDRKRRIPVNRIPIFAGFLRADAEGVRFFVLEVFYNSKR